MKPTAFIRRSALSNEINVYEPKDINHLIREIHSIGVNINQIVHLCNTVHIVSQEDIDFLMMKMHHIDVSIAVNSKPWEKRQCRT
jgi:aspartokinase